MMTQQQEDGLIRIGGSTFIFAPPPGGFGVQMYFDPSTNETIGYVSVDDSKQGPPGHVHGGAVTTLIDEAMGACVWYRGFRVVAVNLNINLKLAVPLNVEVILRGRVARQEGRKIFTSGELVLPDGQIAADGSGVFVEAPHLVGALGHNPFSRLTD
jgi:hypothetical protein